MGNKASHLALKIKLSMPWNRSLTLKPWRNI